MRDKLFEIVSNTQLTADIFKMTLKTDDLPDMTAGQFLTLELPGRKDLLLRRPFGINGWNKSAGTVDIIFRVRGKGTEYMSELGESTEVQVLLPLGNGFTLAPSHKKVVLLAGGLGVAPLLPMKQTYPDREYYTFLGFKNKSDAVLVKDFKSYSKQTVVTFDDGANGFVTDALAAEIGKIKPDVILACGPEAMFKALKGLNTGNISVYVSLEERMACGIGACLVCACDTAQNGEIHKKRCCKDGPVFLLDEVML